MAVSGAPIVGGALRFDGHAGTSINAASWNGRYTPGMDHRERRILDVASLVREAAAMNDAALALDLGSRP